MATSLQNAEFATESKKSLAHLLRVRVYGIVDSTYLSVYGTSKAAVTTDKTRVCPKRTVQLLSSSVYWKDTFR